MRFARKGPYIPALARIWCRHAVGASLSIRREQLHRRPMLGPWHDEKSGKSRRPILRRTTAAGKRRSVTSQLRASWATHLRFHQWQCGGSVPKERVPTMQIRREENRFDWRFTMEHLGGNSENFIRPQTCRRGCTLYSQRSVGGRERCAEIRNRGTTASATAISETV